MRQLAMSGAVRLAAVLAAVLFLGHSALSAAPVAAKIDLSSSLLVTGRESLRVCLMTGGGVSHARAATRLAEVFDQVRQHPDWASARYGESAPEMETGCAADVAPERLSGRGAIGAGVTDHPGPYRTVLVVVDGPQADRTLRGRPALLFPYESMRLDSGNAATVTQGLILRQSVLDQPKLARLLITAAVGLETESGSHAGHAGHGDHAGYGDHTDDVDPAEPRKGEG